MKLYVGLGICALLSAGCAGQPKPLTTTEMLKHHNCQRVAAGIKQVQATDLSSMRVTRMLVDPKDKSAVATATAPSQSMLVVVSRGQQPTPGYGLTLASAQLIDNQVELEFTWQEPDPDSMLAQVITNPCIVIAMPSGNYAGIRASDQRGEIGVLALQ